ncbi:hypothetical protein Desaci_4791 (plasmid) [Desulfosporosinus acidiphilus SJ4]|uniref:Uncharacterized protein n=1 Tax=Desulfosporosinus acidiphilus (strain DSM 22704 / JCM 16185 / SJ4) TaxID=646529 RepID=I4DCU1_DESAJ|nr:hypothetical protein [Desulfosporosinus acidiphilus]AFM43615.1 hypothetical protein Desaci_4791 [Desulfosporosinus acidiphilus SJ4]
MGNDGVFLGCGGLSSGDKEVMFHKFEPRDNQNWAIVAKAGRGMNCFCKDQLRLESCQEENKSVNPMIIDLDSEYRRGSEGTVVR